MDLWNEYEGRSVAGLFPLERLIRPEGRSAFFWTNSAGTSTVIRLIESHFDEEEILARWTGVSDLHQPNLLTLTRFGHTMMDETSLVYVVMEPTEADLGQILCERPLTLAETRQVAGSLIPALQALHQSGFLHEHIQPANVLAVGEVVKLRSDCIREAPQGPEAAALRLRDVQDLATLLLQCLTQQRVPSNTPTGPPLPAPFREIIENGISGTWDLTRMMATLDASGPKPAEVHEPSRIKPSSESAAASTPSPERTAEVQSDIRPNESRQRPINHSAHQPLGTHLSDRVQVPMRSRSTLPRRSIILLALAAFCLVALAIFAGLHGRRGTTQATSAANVPASSPGTTQTPVPGQSTSTAAAPPAPMLAAPEKQSNLPPSRDEWRIVVFTYNGKAEAAGKARALEQRFASLHPAVFTPTGRAPYMVTLGGPLTRDAAFKLRNKLRGAGLPRDLYAQNYSSRPR